MKVTNPSIVRLPVEVIPPFKATRVVVVAPRLVTAAKVSASVAVKVRVPPRETDPPPVNIPAELTVREELASSVLATQPAQVTSEALIVPVPEKSKEAPVPTTMAAVMFVPLVRSVKEPEKLLDPVAS